MSTTDLAQQVADLTTATTKLTEEVVGQKDRLTAAADTATGKATDASGSAQAAAQSVTDAAAEVTKATNQANTAGIEADRAKTEADRASEVSGLDTVEQAVDTALGEFAGLMAESEARAIQKQNENSFAASGFVNSGKHYIRSGYLAPVVNEGINVSQVTSTANKVMLGNGSAYANGTSKTDFAVTHIAGAVINAITQANIGYGETFAFELPQAPDGTVIYDSTGNARGSGKASIDLKVDVDPKYGDVPTGTEDEILREAVSRAFEGDIPNGNFRFGDNGTWDFRGTTSINSSGVLTGNGTDDVKMSVVTGGVARKMTARLEVISGNCRFRIVSNSNSFTDFTYGVGIHEINLDYTVAFANNAKTGSIFFYLYPENAKFEITDSLATEVVVTHPVDLVGLEYFEEELTGRQEIFECIQSLSTTFGTTSVPTVLSTRKLSYFQQYDGQFPEVTTNPDFINDRYRCVVWDDLTEPQKREVAAYMGEKLFVGVNGHIVNGRLRARTIRGLGNGDWGNTSTIAAEGLQASFSGYKGYVDVQGNQDTVRAFTDGYVDGGHVYASDNTSWTTGAAKPNNQGTFKASSAANTATTRAYQGRCFFYVVATVPRANKGAYVEGVNEYGTKLCNRNDGAGGAAWYSPLVTKPTTLQQTFVQTTSSGVVGARKPTGAVGQNSGHPDGIFYDGIEAGGLNGVIDWRLPAIANDSPEEAAKVEAKVENGTYRGLEKLVWTEVNIQTSTTASGQGIILIPKGGIPPRVGERLWHEQGDGSGYVERTIIAIDDNTYPDSHRLTLDPTVYRKENGHVLIGHETNLSVSGEFNTQIQWGEPSKLLTAFPNGWLGLWGGLTG